MPRLLLFLLAFISLAAGLSLTASSQAGPAESRTYIVLLKGTQGSDGLFHPTSDAAVASVRASVQQRGGTLASDLSRQIGVLIVTSARESFRRSAIDADLNVEGIAEDFGWAPFPPLDEALASGPVHLSEGAEGDTSRVAGVAANDPLEAQQWDMEQIRSRKAHQFSKGKRSIEVGVLDTGIDSSHPDFNGPNGRNVDVSRGRDFSIENSGPAVDNGIHGTHVAGIIGAQRNGVGIAGVAPGVTLVPIKVCGAEFCFFEAVLQGITYAGDIGLDVINMSFYVDDEPPAGSTEFKCRDDPQQFVYIKAIQRAINYARGQGVVPVAAMGNEDINLARPPSGPDCDVIPAETRGVIGVAALGRSSQRASYSNGGKPHVDVAAPGGDGPSMNCALTILSTFPNGQWGCIEGTSMASPHVAGVIALILSRFGDRFTPTEVEARLEATAIDLGVAGYDRCFGNGRVDALRAVRNAQGYKHAAASCNGPFSND